MPLKVVLRPGEKVIVNGAVLGAGERTVTLFLHNRANFLRGRDILKEEDVDSLAKATYFLIQLLYVFPEDAAATRHRLAQAMQRLRADTPDAGATLDEVAELLAAGEFYRALKTMRRLFVPAGAAGATEGAPLPGVLAPPRPEPRPPSPSQEVRA